MFMGKARSEKARSEKARGLQYASSLPSESGAVHVIDVAGARKDGVTFLSCRSLLVPGILASAGLAVGAEDAAFSRTTGNG
jgi:hypothetical protein